MDEQKIIFSNRFEKEKFEDYKTDLGTGNAITPDFSEANDFLKFIQKNRRSVPSKERIAEKDKFIKTVYELSNSFEIDADMIEFAEGYIANIYVDYACYTGYIKKLWIIFQVVYVHSTCTDTTFHICRRTLYYESNTGNLFYLLFCS